MNNIRQVPLLRAAYSSHIQVSNAGGEAVIRMMNVRIQFEYTLFEQWLREKNGSTRVLQFDARILFKNFAEYLNSAFVT